MKLLNAVFGTAVVVSVVHYVDNYVNFSAFPQSGSGPEITKDMIWIAWIVFTSAGLAGYALYRRGRILPASALLAFYSVSGLIGIGHYTAEGMTDAVWWRQAHVVADILLGISVFAFAVWSARQARRGLSPA